MGESGTVIARVRLGWRLTGIGMLAVVWWGCLTPSPPNIPQLFPHIDKFEHFFAYLVLAAWFAAIYPQRRQRITILILLIVMGGCIEILQHYPGRDAEWLDWLADIVGVLLGLTWPARWLGVMFQALVNKYARAN
jgi:VanZ family protein